MKLSAGFNLGWPTAVWLSEFKVQDQFIESAIVGGIHPDMEDIALDRFDTYLRETLGVGLNQWDYRTTGWVNRYETSGMDYHTHAGAQISSVMYLEGEDGDIVFHDPRSFASRGYDMTFRHLFEPMTHTPKAGDIVIFPSFLYHTVRNASRMRISCPIDLFLFDDD